jgi:hypothetical protein
MKDKRFIYYGNPCTMAMANPAIQSFSDLPAGEKPLCSHRTDRSECADPRFGCVQVAGVKMARYVIDFYAEATERTLAIEKEEFRRRAPFPPDKMEAYIDIPERNYQHITDPEVITQRVWEYARSVLDLKPGEEIFRSSEEDFNSPLGQNELKIVAGHSKATT